MHKKGIDPIDTIIHQALREDGARSDVTTRWLVGPREEGLAEIIVKEEAIICGLAIARRVFEMLDRNIQFVAYCRDGHEVAGHTKIMSLRGKTRALLSAERTALNFLSYLSGIATTAHRYVQAVSGYQVKILDTRKTTPALRQLERYATRCAGVVNHRSNLKDMVLVKDNHYKVCGQRQTIPQMVGHLRKVMHKAIEVEVDTPQQLAQALAAGPDIILLDNMPIKELRRAVVLRNKMPGRRPLLEASGGITLRNIRQVARTGVERISVGALTHSHRSIDISMEMRG